MSSGTKVRSVPGWDSGLAAAIAAVVLLGWLTAAAAHPERLACPARPFCPAGEYSPRARPAAKTLQRPARPPALLDR